MAANNPKTLLLELKRNDADKSGYQPLKVVITNRGKSKVTLLAPGDGSEMGWRSSMISWSVLKTPIGKHPWKLRLNKEPRCGNTNALSAGEVFEIAPGQSHTLSSWLNYPDLGKPGLYRVRFYYDNVPSLQWRGGDLGTPDKDALERVRNSTPCSLISNELVFIAGERKTGKSGG